MIENNLIIIQYIIPAISLLVSIYAICLSYKSNSANVKNNTINQKKILNEQAINILLELEKIADKNKEKLDKETIAKLQLSINLCRLDQLLLTIELIKNKDITIEYIKNDLIIMEILSRYKHLIKDDFYNKHKKILDQIGPL